MQRRRRDPHKTWVEIGFEDDEIEALKAIMVREGIRFRATAARFAVLAVARQLRSMIVTETKAKGKK